MYQNIPTKVLTGEVRLSYAHLNEPYANASTPGAKKRYSVTLLIPKTDVATKADIDSAIKSAGEPVHCKNDLAQFEKLFFS